MSSEEENFGRCASLEFRGVKHDVEFSIENDELQVQVEDSETFDQWSGKFGFAYIEELTHKTGNYKQFSIFCSMFDSALNQASESVSLDLLTYDDLKILREQKFGSSKPKKRQQESSGNKLQSKRYLILTYTVEFDQIHYPLPLTYCGSSDPASLKLLIRQLKQEIHTLKRGLVNTEGQFKESDVNMLVRENERLKQELAHMQKQLKDVGAGNVSKELKVLKKVVSNLESDLLKERNKHQRLAAKKKKEYDELVEEFEELKANERNFRVRCKSLTGELSMLKRNSRLTPVSNNRTIRNNTTRTRHSIVNSANKNRTSNTARRDSDTVNRGRSKTRSISRERERSLSASSFRRTPSPGYRRFDPSAYVKEKERKRQEAEANKSRRTPTSTSKRIRTPTSFGRTAKPPSGGGRTQSAGRRSLRQSVESDNSIGRINKRSGNRSGNRARTTFARSDTSGDEYYERSAPRARVTASNRKLKSSNKSSGNEDEDSGGHSIGIAEIDARLEALQRFMKDNIE